jgi:hypothetical protein
MLFHYCSRKKQKQKKKKYSSSFYSKENSVEIMLKAKQFFLYDAEGAHTTHTA